MPRYRRRRSSLALGAIVAAMLIAGALVRDSDSRNNSNHLVRDLRSAGGGTVEEKFGQQPRADEVAGFRLLVTILAGVSLGAAASVLPNLMASPATGEFAVAMWVLWAAGIFAVILTYLSTLTGAKLIPIEIDLLHTASLTLKTACECGLFASLTVPQSNGIAHWWFTSFAAFGATATVAILLGLWILPQSPVEIDPSILARYRRGQWSDAAMAALTAVLSTMYVWRSPEPSSRSVLVAAVIAFASMVAACLKQYFERRRFGLPTT